MSRNIRTFGGPSAFEERVSTTALATRPTRLALLLFVAVERAASRDAVASIFWHNQAPESGRKNLSQALYEIRESVGRGWIIADGDQLRITPDVHVDTHAFEDAVETEEHDQVLRLYAAPFLEGFRLPGYGKFERWADLTRTRLHGLARQSYRASIQGERARSNPEGVVTLARRWTTLDPLDDEAAHELILSLGQLGSRNEALAHFEAFTEALRDELDVEPLQETRDLVHLIRTEGRGRGSIPTPVSGHDPDLRHPELGPISGLEVLALVGRGESGEVFKAREPALSRLVAVKVLAPELAKSKEALLRFEREVLVLAGLHHPNIAPIYRTGTLIDGRPYLVMRHVEGPTLADRLAAHTSLSAEDVLSVMHQLASALATVHASGLVHRDVHPSNVIVDEAMDQVVLSDFGIAGILSAGSAATGITVTGSILGHPDYRAPEGATGPGVTDRADVYSLGVLCYKLLHGVTPTTASLRDQRPLTVGSQLEEIIARCLHQHPQRRPAARDLVTMLGSQSDLSRKGSGRSLGRLNVGALLIGAIIVAGVVLSLLAVL